MANIGLVSSGTDAAQDPLKAYDDAKAQLEQVRAGLIIRLQEIEIERAEIKAKLGRTRTRKAKTAK